VSNLNGQETGEEWKDEKKQCQMTKSKCPQLDSSISWNLLRNPTGQANEIQNPNVKKIFSITPVE